MVETFSLLLALIVAVVILIFITLFGILVYSGIFHAIEDVSTGKSPVRQLIIAYKFQKGPYSEAGQIFTEAAIVAPANKAIGIYYDDPKKVHSLHLRYAVGSIVSQGDAPVDENMVKQFTDRGFKILHLPEVSYAVQTQFPHTTPLSILIGIHKAYPRLEEYIEEHKLCAHPCMEYYDGANIHFFAPLSKQDEFYVPEYNLEASRDENSFQSLVDSNSESEILEESQQSVDDNRNHGLSDLGGDITTMSKERKRDGENELQMEEMASQNDNDVEDDNESSDDLSSFEVVKKEKDV